MTSLPCPHEGVTRGWMRLCAECARKRRGTPILDSLLRRGLIWLDGNEYVARSTVDPTKELSLGDIHNKEGLERYLEHFAPCDW